MTPLMKFHILEPVTTMGILSSYTDKWNGTFMDIKWHFKKLHPLAIAPLSVGADLYWGAVQVNK